MKKLLLLFILSLTSFLSYSQDKKINQLDSNGCKTGLWIEYYSNGNVEVESEYKDGLKNGLTKCYYENGELWEIGYFINNKLEGISITYSKNGKIKYLDLYKNGIEIKNLKNILE